MIRSSAATLALVITILIARDSRGDVTMELVDRGVPSDGHALAQGYAAYILRLTSDEGPIAAVDFSSGSYGIFGPLVQRWTSSNEDGVYDEPSPGYLPSQNVAASGGNFDSHFLSVTSPLTMGAPSEDATIVPAGSQFGSFPTSDLLKGYGQGSKLTACYGIIGAYQKSTLDLAYLVIPDGATINVKGLVAPAGSSNSVPIVTARAWTSSGTVWDSETANKSWTFWGTPSAFSAGEDVQFGGAGLANGLATVPVAAQGVDPRAITIANNFGTYTFSGGAIRSSGRLLKSRRGAVVFENPVTCAGTVTIDGGSIWAHNSLSAPAVRLSSGTLGGTGTIASTVYLKGGVLQPGTPSDIGALTVDNLASTGGDIDVRFRISPTSNDRVIITTPDAVSQTSFRPTILDAGGAQAGTYQLLDYAGKPPSNLSDLLQRGTTLGRFYVDYVDNRSNTSVDVTLTQAPTWNVDADGAWSQSANWTTISQRHGKWLVNFGTVITSPRTVLVDSDTTTNSTVSIRFDSPVSYTIAGSGSLSPDSVDVLSGSHTIATPVAVRNTTITVEKPDQMLTITGAVSGADEQLHFPRYFKKSGPGTLKLTGPNTLVGRTDVDAGTLIVNATHIGGTGYLVYPGAALAGSGTISSTVLADGGEISPGESAETPATLTVGGLKLNNALLKFDVASGRADRIVVTNLDSFSLQGISTIVIDGALTSGDFPLIDYTGAALPDGGHLLLASASQSGLPMMLEYDAAHTSIDLLAGSAIQTPEPACVALSLLLYLALPRRRAN
jgi:autotransporter-associated beta strand protein